MTADKSLYFSDKVAKSQRSQEAGQIHSWEQQSQNSDTGFQILRPGPLHISVL